MIAKFNWGNAGTQGRHTSFFRTYREGAKSNYENFSPLPILRPCLTENRDIGVSFFP
jgi:hypothetical protein